MNLDIDKYYAVKIIHPIRCVEDTQLCITGVRLKAYLKNGGFHFNNSFPCCKIISWNIDDSLWAKSID